MSGPTDPSEAHFDKGQWGFDGTVWRRLQLLWGYYDRWAEDLGGTKSGAGTYQAQTTVVPAGYVYVLQCVSLVNDGGSRGRTRFFLMGGVNYVCLAAAVTPAQFVPLVWNGGVPLKEGDSVLVQMVSCLDADVLYGGAWGYKMRVNL